MDCLMLRLACFSLYLSLGTGRRQKTVWKEAALPGLKRPAVISHRQTLKLELAWLRDYSI
jgi:hypothetical protein